ncbi:MAG: outer membrane beta-barrel protein [Candidatus Aminicenantales bacterium]
MKKFAIGCVLLVFLTGAASASMFMVEVKGGYFNPQGEVLRSDYGTVFTLGGEVTFGILPGLKLWGAGNYYTAKGRPPYALDSRITFTPLGGGLKYLFPMGRIRLYGGAGVNYLNYKLKSPGGDESATGVGYVFKVGVLIKIKALAFIDLFLENSYGKVNPPSGKINLGGITAGIGIGLQSLI